MLYFLPQLREPWFWELFHQSPQTWYQMFFFCYNFKNCSKIFPKFPQKSVKLISKIQNELFSSDVCYIFTPNLLVFLLRRNTWKTLKHYTCQLKFLTAEWQLGISVDKSNVLFIGKGNSTGQFCINVIPLPVVTECRDLGVTITHDLSLSSHISYIIFKTHQRTNLIHRCFVTRNPNLNLVLENRIWYGARYSWPAFLSSGLALPGASLSSCISAVATVRLDHYSLLKGSSTYGINSQFLSLT